MVRTSDIMSAVEAGRGLATVRQLLDEVDPDASAEQGVAHLHRDHPLGLALARMGTTGHTVLPVVSRANARTILGIVTLPAILNAYGVERIADVPGAKTSVRDE